MTIAYKIQRTAVTLSMPANHYPRQIFNVKCDTKHRTPGYHRNPVILRTGCGSEFTTNRQRACIETSPPYTQSHARRQTRPQLLCRPPKHVYYILCLRHVPHRLRGRFVPLTIGSPLCRRLHILPRQPRQTFSHQRHDFNHFIHNFMRRGLSHRSGIRRPLHRCTNSSRTSHDVT